MNLTPDVLPDSVSVVDGVSGRPALAVRAPFSSGIVQLHGAQVTSFVPDGGQEVLWLSPDAVAGPTTAIRGGVPVCFPWFNSGPAGDRKPSHGPARLADWQLAGVEESVDALSLTFNLTSEEVADVPGGRDWPAGLGAEYTITFGRALDLTFTACNESGEDLAFELALHAYLGVSDVARVAVEGVAGRRYRDQARSCDGSYGGALRIEGEVDHLVAAGDAVPQLRDRDRAITLAREGFGQVVIWNPGAQKASGMSDVPGESWRRFVCLEAAAATDGAVTLQSDGTATLRARYQAVS